MDSSEINHSEISDRTPVRMSRGINVTWIRTGRDRTLSETTIQIENPSVVRNILTEPWLEYIVAQKHYTFKQGMYT